MRPTMAAVGDLLLETDTRKTYTWDGTSWEIYDPGDEAVPYLKEIISQLELLRQETVEGFLNLH